jgi:NADH-quinone oxidoreductase subunit N
MFIFIKSQLIQLPLLPEFILLGTALGILLYGSILNFFQYKNCLVQKFTSIAFLALLISNLFIFISLDLGAELYYNDSLVFDFGTQFTKFLLVTVGLICLLMTRQSLKINQIVCYEYFILYLLAIMGGMFFVSCADLMYMYIALELQSFCLYTLVALNHRTTLVGSEASIKYFILGVASSIFLLISILYFYITLVTSNLHDISSYFSVKFPSQLSLVTPLGGLGTFLHIMSIYEFKIIIGIFCFFIALFFKLTLVPFHMWVPDVYEGSPLPVVVFISTIPKIAVIHVLLRVTSDYFTNAYYLWQPLFGVVGLLSVIVGILNAMRQFNMKRFIAYSSIAHMGYILLAMSGCTYISSQICFYYFLIYLITILSFWSLFLSVETKYGRSFTSWLDWGGIFNNCIIFGSHLVIILLSLGGLPPVAAFYAKVSLFKGLLGSSMYIITLFLLLFSLLSVYYYIRIIKVVLFDAKSKFPVVRQNIDFISALIGSTLPLLLVFFFYFDILSPVIELYTWSLYFPNS